MSPQPFMVGNRWRDGAGQSFVSVNPQTGREGARIASAGSEDVFDAVSAAQAALQDPRWSALKQHERARLLYRFGDIIERDTERLALIQMEDNGKTLSECRSQARSAAATFRYYGAVCETFENTITPQRSDSLTMSVYEPVGVVAAITPWNSPLTLEAQKIAPALAGGNAVILKSSEVTPRIGLEYARIAMECDLPPGTFNVLTGASDIGRQLVDADAVDMVSFTGGTASGRAIAAACGQKLKRVVLELGGKSPHIVFADADLKRAVDVVADGIFSGGGQSCVAGSRVFVERSVYQQFVDNFVEKAKTYTMGDPSDPATRMGPMVSAAHRDSVDRAVDVARAEGAKILSGGDRPSDTALAQGAFYPATVIGGLSNTSKTAQQEIFGPVAVVIPFSDEDDLLVQANQTEFGLAAGIWSSDFSRAWRVARGIRAGTVWINTYKELSISTPFGGFKQSGVGREKGRQGMLTYMEPKGVYWHVG